MADVSLDKILRFGLYPSVFQAPETEAAIELEEIASNYPYKDILTFERVKSSTTLSQLLQLLALQLGNEVLYHEIGQKLSLDSATVKRYIDLLEKCFVLVKLTALSRNPRVDILKENNISIPYYYELDSYKKYQQIMEKGEPAKKKSNKPAKKYKKLPG